MCSSQPRLVRQRLAVESFEGTDKQYLEHGASGRQDDGCVLLPQQPAGGCAVWHCSGHTTQPPTRYCCAAAAAPSSLSALPRPPYSCTAVTAVVVGDRLLVANVGDSRAVLSRGGRGMMMTMMMMMMLLLLMMMMMSPVLSLTLTPPLPTRAQQTHAHAPRPGTTLS